MLEVGARSQTPGCSVAQAVAYCDLVKLAPVLPWWGTRSYTGVEGLVLKTGVRSQTPNLSPQLKPIARAYTSLAPHSAVIIVYRATAPAALPRPQPAVPPRSSGPVPNFLNRPLWTKPTHTKRDLGELRDDYFSPLRKNRIYIKSRFSRVRQWCRPIVI